MGFKKSDWHHLPLVIGFQRTGFHWLNMLMEVYFDRNRTIPHANAMTFVNQLHKGYMWCNDHDIDLEIIPQNELGTIYIYREPVDTLYSVLDSHLRKQDDDEKDLPYNDLFNKWLKKYRDHLQKWLLSENKAKTIITYEALNKNPEKCLEIISYHFNKKFDQKQAQYAIDFVTKERVFEKGSNIKKAFFDKQNLTEEYQRKREEFRQQYEDYIYDYMRQTPGLTYKFYKMKNMIKPRYLYPAKGTKDIYE